MRLTIRVEETNIDDSVFPEAVREINFISIRVDNTRDRIRSELTVIELLEVIRCGRGAECGFGDEDEVVGCEWSRCF